MRYTFLLTSILLFFNLSAQVKWYTPELTASSLDTMPWNQFFMYTPKDHHEYEEYAMCMKFTGNTEKLIEALKVYHDAEPEVREEKGRTYYEWINFKQPMIFFASHYLEVWTEAQDSFDLLSFRYGYFNQNRRGKEIFSNGIKGGLGALANMYWYPLILEVMKREHENSPFAWSYNTEIFFLSKEKRKEIGLMGLVEVEHLPKGETGGMQENWSVNEITFSDHEVADEWYPLQKEEDYQLDMGDLLDGQNPLNGTYYHFENGRTISWGGGGYGSFDFHELHYLDGEKALKETRCEGHCGPEEDIFYAEVLFKDSIAQQVISYGKVEQEFDDAAEALHYCHDSLESVDVMQNVFNNNGLLTLQISGNDTTRFPEQLKNWPRFEGKKPPLHQVYASSERNGSPFVGGKLEAFISSRLVIYPNVLIIEISHNQALVYRRIENVSGYARVGMISLF